MSLDRKTLLQIVVAAVAQAMSPASDPSETDRTVEGSSPADTRMAFSEATAPLKSRVV